MQPPALDTLEQYRQRFTDVAYWTPYVQIVCQRHRLFPCAPIRTGLAGTFPVFIVAERWVVKFFGMLFDGLTACHVEKEAATLAAAVPGLPVLPVLDAGALLPDGGWPYLIFPFVPGVSIGAVMAELPWRQKLALAAQLGRWLRQLHGVSLDNALYLRPSWRPYGDFLAQQRETVMARLAAWGSLPPHLLAQVPDYLLPLTELVDERRLPALLHADVTADHVLGALQGGSWQTHALIDFGDALVGDPVYELIPLHLDLFQRDRRLLRTYLDAYGVDAVEQQALPHRAMNLALLHPFNVLEHSLAADEWAADTLSELAACLWQTWE